MKAITLWCVSILLVTSMVLAEKQEEQKPKGETEQKEQEQSKEAAGETDQEQEFKMPSKESEGYWTIRSQAMTDLMPFLTGKRKEMKENIQLLADYLLMIDRASDFAASDIEVPDDPELYAKAIGIYDKLKDKKVAIPEKSLTWDETAELAMRFVLMDGYVPVDVDGQAELEQYKKICLQKERYAKKVRQELRGYTTKCLKAWLYLGTIDEQANYRTYAFEVKAEAAAAKKEYYRRGREELASRERARREQTRQNNWQARQNRANRYYGYYR